MKKINLPWYFKIRDKRSITTEEQEQLKEAIIAYLADFKKALEQDLLEEEAPNFDMLKTFINAQKFLHERKNARFGFAFYLYDYRGVHDEFFTKNLELLRILDFYTIVLSKYDGQFPECYFRLIEITRNYQASIKLATKEDVAIFIISNFYDFYYGKSDWLQGIYKNLKAHKKRMKRLGCGYMFLPCTPEWILYKLCRKQLSFWHRF